jgi:hypothetical protein
MSRRNKEKPAETGGYNELKRRKIGFLEATRLRVVGRLAESLPQGSYKNESDTMRRWAGNGVVKLWREEPGGVTVTNFIKFGTNDNGLESPPLIQARRELYDGRNVVDSAHYSAVGAPDNNNLRLGTVAFTLLQARQATIPRH